MATVGQVAQKLLDVKITTGGKVLSELMWQGLLGLLGGASVILSWAKPFWSFFMDRLFSWGIDELILGLNLIGMEMTANEQVKVYLKAYKKGKEIDADPKATKEMKNAAFNELFDASVELWSLRKLQSVKGGQA